LFVLTNDSNKKTWLSPPNLDNKVLFVMLRSLIVFLSVVLAVAFLPQGALASDNGIGRQLQTKRCPPRYQWTRPSWWRKYKRQLTTKVLKKCKFLEGKVPAAGATCEASREGIVCLFGEARCNNVVEPETKCQCKDGVWVCYTVCDQPKCPVAMPQPSGTCDPQVNVKSCDYGEYCCGDSCVSTAFCSCEPDKKGSTWLCAIASVVQCDETSLEEAGCPCDRPINGDSCTGDYGCGDACCGADAYTCKCNAAGIYESCGKTGFVPGPLIACACLAPDPPV